MIPIENSAGGAAAGFHDQPEGAPDQNADQVTHIEKDRNDKKQALMEKPYVIECADQSDEQTPEKENLIRRFGGGDHITFQSGAIDLFQNGFEASGKQFLGAEREFVFDRNDLLEHIKKPDKPKQMKDRKPLEELHAIQDIKNIGLGEAEEDADEENDAPGYQPEHVSFSDF